ncbi:MAG: DsrE family protein [Candidatus Hydrothermarchaeales archaeon]
MESLLIVSMAGPKDPDRAILPFVTATMAKVSRIDVRIFLLGEATLLITNDYVDKVQGKVFPSLRKALEDALKEDIEIYICSRYMKSYDLGRKDFAVRVTISSLAKLAELAQENSTLNF